MGPGTYPSLIGLNEMVVPGLAIIPSFAWKAPLSLITFVWGNDFLFRSLVAMIQARRVGKLSSSGAVGVPSAAQLQARFGGLFSSVFLLSGTWCVSFSFLIWLNSELALQSILWVLLALVVYGWITRRSAKALGAMGSCPSSTACPLPDEEQARQPTNGLPSSERVFDYHSHLAERTVLLPWMMAIFVPVLCLLIHRPKDGPWDIICTIAMTAGMLLIAGRMLVGYLNERIILSAGDVTWFDWRGRKRLVVVRSEFPTRADRLPLAARGGVAFRTSRGTLKFTKELAGYEELIAILTEKDSAGLVEV